MTIIVIVLVAVLVLVSALLEGDNTTTVDTTVDTADIDSTATCNIADSWDFPAQIRALVVAQTRAIAVLPCRALVPTECRALVPVQTRALVPVQAQTKVEEPDFSTASDAVMLAYFKPAPAASERIYSHGLDFALTMCDKLEYEYYDSAFETLKKQGVITEETDSSVVNELVNALATKELAADVAATCQVIDAHVNCILDRPDTVLCTVSQRYGTTGSRL